MILFMLNQEKKDIVKAIIPSAVLKAVSPEAKKAMMHHHAINEFACIYKFPFFVGREMRTKLIDGHLQVMERRKNSDSTLNNDLYLVDNGGRLQISREHFTIEHKNGEYMLHDRGSRCGIMIGDIHIGGKDLGGSYPLIDGDIIGVGKATTTYLFKFIVIDQEQF